jgi:hypothetical protein
MQTHAGKIVSADRPFEGQGVSVYVGQASPAYRKPRVFGHRSIPLGTQFTGAKTRRVAALESTAGSVSLDATIPVELRDLSQVAIDVRHFRDDCECEVSAPQLVAIDAGGEQLEVLDGRAIGFPTEIRSEGVARLFWRYIAIQGVPYRFRLHRLSGPTSPADVTVLYQGPELYDVDFEGLSSGDYTFQLTAENEASTVILTLIDSDSWSRVDADGPDAVTGLTVEVR